MKPSRSQRRLPFTSWPRPGTSTRQSNANAMASSTIEYFSQTAVGIITARAAAPSPSPTYISWRWK